jgi:Transposase DDE domain group 1
MTDQQGEDIARLDLDHRGHARVEDRVRCGKDTGMRNLPFRELAPNEVWLELSLIAQELVAWTKSLALEDELARSEPKRLRYRLLHQAGRIARSGRRVRLRLERSWPWAQALVAAFEPIRALPPPAPPRARAHRPDDELRRATGQRRPQPTPTGRPPALRATATGQPPQRPGRSPHQIHRPRNLPQQPRATRHGLLNDPG